MTKENEETVSASTMHQVPPTDGNTMVLRIPKPNVQVAVLGLVAFITLFQTFQLVQISAKAGSAPVKTAPAAVTNTGSGGSGSNTDVPQSMVGGC